MKSILLTLTIFFGFFLESSAQAQSNDGALISVGLLKYSIETEGKTIGNGKDDNLYYDIKAGILRHSFFFGGEYSYHDRDNSGSETKRTLYGLTIGYHGKEWYGDFSYFLEGQMVTPSLTYKKPNGYGLDLGYNFQVGSSLQVGLEATYKSYTFQQYESSGTTVSEDNKVKSELYPLLVLGFTF